MVVHAIFIIVWRHHKSSSKSNKKTAKYSTLLNRAEIFQFTDRISRFVNIKCNPKHLILLLGFFLVRLFGSKPPTWIFHQGLDYMQIMINEKTLFLGCADCSNLLKTITIHVERGNGSRSNRLGPFKQPHISSQAWTSSDQITFPYEEAPR